MDEHIKNRATETLAAIGLPVSDGVRVLLTRVAAGQRLPLRAPGTEGRSCAAMGEARPSGEARASHRRIGPLHTEAERLLLCADYA